LQLRHSEASNSLSLWERVRVRESPTLANKPLTPALSLWEREKKLSHVFKE
jgi:hypothetical protein